MVKWPCFTEATVEWPCLTEAMSSRSPPQSFGIEPCAQEDSVFARGGPANVFLKSANPQIRVLIPQSQICFFGMPVRKLQIRKFLILIRKSQISNQS
jgi:hypothetical protein